MPERLPPVTSAPRATLPLRGGFHGLLPRRAESDPEIRRERTAPRRAGPASLGARQPRRTGS